MIYLDTNVLMGILCPEPQTALLQAWFSKSGADALACSPWCRTELGSALAMKQRTKQLGASEAAAAMKMGLQILSSTQCESFQDSDFDEAMQLCTNLNWSLRAPDALHLAIARRVGCDAIATLDELVQKAARKIGLRPIKF